MKQNVQQSKDYPSRRSFLLKGLALVHFQRTFLGKGETKGALHTVPQTAFPLNPGRGGPLHPLSLTCPLTLR